MPRKQHEPGKAVGQADIAQGSLGQFGHLLGRKADVPVLGSRHGFGAMQPQPGHRRGPREPAGDAAEAAGRPRKLDPRDQRNRRQHAQAGRQQRAAGHAEAAHVNLMRCRGQQTPRRAASPIGVAQRVHDFLGHPMPRLNDDRTQRREMGVGDAPIVNRHAKEPGHAERLDVAADFLNVAAKRLLAGVDAKHRLKARRGLAGGRLLGVHPQRVERLTLKVPFECPMQQPASLEIAKGVDLRDQRQPILARQSSQATGRPAHHLRQLKDDEGRPVAGGQRSLVASGHQHAPQLIQLPDLEGRALDEMFDRQAFQNQVDRHELQQRASRRGRREAVGAQFHMPQQAGPTAQRQQRRLQDVGPFLFRIAENAQRFANRLERLHLAIAKPGDFSRQAVRPMMGRPALSPIEVKKRLVKAVGFGRHRPTGQALVGERRAKADQQVVR